MKTVLILLFSSLFILSCQSKKTDHLLNLKDPYGIHEGTLVVDVSGNQIGIVTEIIEDDYGTRQFLEIEESYLKYPSAEFMKGMDRNGNATIIAYYDEK